MIPQGMCYARLRRFFYDAGSGICKQFFFGGCRGNANNFLTESACIEKCVRTDALPRALAGFNEDVRNPCDQDKVVGLCRQGFQFAPVESDLSNIQEIFR